MPDIAALIGKAAAYKRAPNRDHKKWTDLRVGMIFFNPSLRTRMSTQIAAKNLGMDTVVFNACSEAWSLEFADGAVMDGNSVEHIRDAAAVMGQYFDILAVRSFPALKSRAEDEAEQVLRQIALYAKIPVISLESATLHPLQSLADVMTIQENWQHATRQPKVVLSWAPHIKALPHCVGNSFAQWMNAWGGAEFVIAQPEGYELDPRFTGKAGILHDQQQALQDADFVYVKNWSSYRDYGKVLPVAEDWMLTERKLQRAPKASVMHCLPVRRNVELSDELLDRERSLVQQQAANRVWAAQAVLDTIASSI